MDNTPKSIDQQVKADAAAAVQAELASVKTDQAGSSWLRQGIDFITKPYNRESAALDELQQVSQKLGKPGTGATPQDQALALKAINDMEAARQRELDSYKIISGAAKTAVTFTPGKLGLAAAGTVYALDSVGAAGTSTSDAFWGFTKGALMRGAVSQIAKGQDSPALMSLKLGLASRVIDTSLTPSNFVNRKSGDLTWGSFGEGLLTTGKVALNPISVGSDLALAGLATGVLKVAPKALAGNTFRAMSTVAFTHGYASGLAEEVQNEHQKGQYSPERLALYPLATALSQTLAAAPGNQSLQVRNWPRENALTIRDLDYKLVAISPADVKAIASGGGRAVEATVKPIGEELKPGDPETMAITRAKVPTDWIAAALKSVKPSSLSANEDQLRFVSRPKGDENAPWQMVLNRGTSTVSQLIKGNSNYYQGGEVAPFLKQFAEPATRYLGSGSESGAFQLANGTVLKVSSGSSPDSVANWGKLPFDAQAPFSPLIFGKEYNPYNRSIVSNVKTILLQEPLKTPVKESQAATLREDMANAKVSFWDYNYHLMGDQVSSAVEQVGIDATGKPVMLDYGARRPYWGFHGYGETPAAKPDAATPPPPDTETAQNPPSTID
jgi:hypothetical protein